MTKQINRPGTKAVTSGQYELVGSRGGRKGTEVTVTKGEPFPPSPLPGQGYILIDKTKHSK